MIKVIAKNFVKEDRVNKVLEIAKELVAATLKEEGCINYEMYQDVKNPQELIFVEEWKSIEALNAHMASEHFTRIVPSMSEHMDKKPEMNICKKLL